MDLIWKLGDSDINRIGDFVKKYKNPNVEKIINKNINHVDKVIDKDSLLRAMLICLMSSETDSYPESKIKQIFNKKPFLLSCNIFSKSPILNMHLKRLFKHLELQNI